ncbi:MAG: ABC transporter substrate-binding protein [Rhodospirillales bacterium]
MNTGTLFVATFAWALVLAGASDRARADEPYALGVALGFTGTGAPYAREALEGIEIAVDEINADGGLLGRHPINLFTRNTKTRPDVARVVVEDLIRDHRVRAVIGTYSSGTALAIKPVLRDAKVLHIATISNSEDITRLDPSPYTFSVVPNTYMMARGVAVGIAELARKSDWRSFVTVASDYEWGRSSQQIQVASLARLAPELELVEELWPPLGHVGFNSVVVAVRNLKPDFVLASLAGADNARWDLAAWDYRLADHTAIVGGLISVTELIGQANWIRRGTWGRTRAPFFAHLDVPMMARFVAAYRARFDRYPSDWAVMSYDGVHALRQGVERGGSIDTEKVREAMTGLAVDTTRGRLFFREIDNQLSCSAYFGRVADDPAYDFPIYADLSELKGPDIWRPEEEIRAARGQ